MIPFQGMASRSLRKTLLDCSNVHTLKRQRKDLLLQVFDTKCFQKRELGPMPGVDWNKPKCFWQHRNFHAGIMGRGGGGRVIIWGTEPRAAGNHAGVSSGLLEWG